VLFGKLYVSFVDNSGIKYVVVCLFFVYFAVKWSSSLFRFCIFD